LPPHCFPRLNADGNRSFITVWTALKEFAHILILLAICQGYRLMSALNFFLSSRISPLSFQSAQGHSAPPIRTYACAASPPSPTPAFP
jgi:hypothetical protein